MESDEFFDLADYYGIVKYYFTFEKKKIILLKNKLS